MLVLAVVLGGCLCDGDRFTLDDFAPMRLYAHGIERCVVGRDCQPLCAAVFGLDDGVRIERCQVLSRVYEADARPGDAAPLDGLQGVTLRVEYVEQVPCDDGSYDDGGYDDGGYDDGGYDDGGDDPCDDGSCDDPDDGGDDPGDGGDDGGDDDDDGDWLARGPRR
jgi:hypothetical protein